MTEYVLRQLWRSTRLLKFAALAAGLASFLIAGSGSAAEGSLSDLDIEIEHSELKVTLDKVLGENKKLHAALAEAERTQAEMRKNVANAEGESEIFKRQAMELKKRMEALGLHSGSADETKLEQRLLRAVSDLRVTTDEKKKLAEALVRLSEAASLFAKTATLTNTETRAALEGELRNARTALGVASPNAVEASAYPASLMDAVAISVKEDLALVVINLGSKQGVKVGMPFQVSREGKLIGNVRVVDVREKFAGAVVQNLYSDSDRIKVGDHLKVDAQQ